MFIAQTLSEYGAITSIVSGITSARDRIEMHIGLGNLKYFLMLMLAILVLFAAKRRRRG